MVLDIQSQVVSLSFLTSLSLIIAIYLSIYCLSIYYFLTEYTNASDSSEF